MVYHILFTDEQILDMLRELKRDLEEEEHELSMKAAEEKTTIRPTTKIPSTPGDRTGTRLFCMQ